MEPETAPWVAEPSSRRAATPGGVVPVVETPFDDRGDVDLTGIPTLVRYLAGTGVEWVMYPGFASEFYKMDSCERSLALGLLLGEGRRHQLKVVASISDHATVLAERSAVAAVEAGAAAINLLPPFLLGPARGEVSRHVERVLDAVHPCPVLLQVAPAFTGSDIDAGWLANLARSRDNLRMAKLEHVPPGPMITALKDAGSTLAVMVGYGGLHLLDALRRGAVGVQPGCSFTELYVAIWRAWLLKDVGQCEATHNRLLPYLAYWMTRVELMVTVEKEISYRRGIIGSAHCRRPYRRLDAEETRMIDRFLVEFERELPALGGPRD